MPSIRPYLASLLFLASPLAAQSAKKALAAPPAGQEDAEAKPFPVQFGVAGGALSYEGGRQEQALGAVLRWVARPWLSLSATPTAVHVREPSALVAGSVQGRTGLVDLPLDATLEHGFKAPWSPGVAFALGVSLPLGDTATGF